MSSINRLPRRLFQNGKLFAKFIKKQKYHLIIFSLLVVVFTLLPGQNIYEQTFLTMYTITNPKLPIVLPTPAPYPQIISPDLIPQITATSSVVLDVDSSVVMYEKNADTPLAPASTVKIMTALVGLDHFRPDDVVEVTEINTEPRVMGLAIGEKITVESLLYGILMHSANDAAVAIAASYPGGTDAFVSKMNEKAASLHLSHTHFTNPVGFDDPDEYITARDLSRLGLVALKNPLLSKIVSTRTITVSDVSYTRFHDLTNVNQLLGRYPGVAGFKTGFTEEAGENLIAYAIRPNGKILTVVLGSRDRFGDTENLLTWSFTNFHWVHPDLPQTKIQQSLN